MRERIVNVLLPPGPEQGPEPEAEDDHEAPGAEEAAVGVAATTSVRKLVPF